MLTKEQFVETLNDYLDAHGYARWESWDINYEWERYQRGRSWSNEFFAAASRQAELQAAVDAAYNAMTPEEQEAMWKADDEDAARRSEEDSPEDRLRKINEIIFAVGAPLGSDEYFQIRELCTTKKL